MLLAPTLRTRLPASLLARTPLRSMATSRAAPTPLLLEPSKLEALRTSSSSSFTPSSSLAILDGTWFMPNLNPPRDARKEYESRPRIPGARFWDVDAVATRGEQVMNLPHMMPTPAVFAEAAAKHGISRDTHVVVYDTHGLFSAPRTAFTFMSFGHTRVSVLDGGLPAWIAQGLPLEEGPPKDVSASEYPPPTQVEGSIRSYEEMLANVAMGARGQTVLDARPKGRFDGTDPEPRQGMSSGHMPHAMSLPFPSLVQQHKSADPRNEGQSYTKLLPQTELWRTVADAVGGMEELEKLRQAGSGGEISVTATCGSGMTAAVIWLALQQLGVQAAIYDESWMGWASRGESPIVKS